ncbi:Flavin-containing monooxygenase FMO OS=Tsukamurella paurometabola (strain ATCC 8368 / DSM /CCUG 35730 / CIP 100753 / JCM 10117 / KCTC 9821 / NBRC 16120/ NCIMB 702349 / NCTC 13040) OX=521096 GN=Tpau_0375 PE=4 SV=1 [Tsukamurella paurometabola]|uniref:Flavin-containing monooxygenase FMO n=1 Tax=Tsukamurella paurometabola (strain ATCC 8368 / DSM 20162 / CCUG 35730 / CIP 100753 / JCM 10117 / KCTC 9821 / NBRC 16120 / NCIMB 702349 / NCTC 13040) TaxID=521096 RepID=D5URG4_TSUPD|nr:NAD(P)/FAD-dependent oxidoreductase [Tsukamurella paurometabola]ADG77017.1 flavin-containing monooxygenase FMO [Tsukamurella paurometabola DSM 20162]SUP42461.1 Uncharacterized oxidoreductase CzcO [Tsukamurella paurometabola]
MSDTEVEALVIGAGQAGIAMSEHLGAHEIPHLVVERDRIAERWHSWRWDSMVANGPAWHDRFPGLEFDIRPDDFAGKRQVADYLCAYAEMINAPIRTGVEVTSVTKCTGRAGFRVDTSQGVIHARYVISATGAFQKPVIPAILPQHARIHQIHSVDYRNPQQLPGGAVLVIGAGSSGVQIADELRSSGRRVFLSVGPHDRPPRRYRGRDFCWWLGVLGQWDAATPPAGAEHVTIAVSGANGGRTVDFRALAADGITLLGRAERFERGALRFSDDLRANIEAGDASYLSMLDEADDYVLRNGLDLPEDPQARTSLPDPECMLDPVREVDLAAEDIRSVVWATGFANDFGWLKVDVFDDRGRPEHQRGVCTEPGIYFLGLPWLSRRGSSFIWGVWHDARHLADQIAIQQGYLRYTGSECARSERGADRNDRSAQGARP